MSKLNKKNVSISKKPWTELPEDVLKTLHSNDILKKLSIKNTKLISLNNKLFTFAAFTKTLTTLTINNNPITSLPDSIGELQALQTLDASNNVLTHIPASVQNLRKLKSLNLSNNKLSSLPKELCHLPELTKFNITHNQIRIIPYEYGALQTLKEFHLVNNPIEVPPHDVCLQGSGAILLWLRAEHKKHLKSSVTTEDSSEASASSLGDSSGSGGNLKTARDPIASQFRTLLKNKKGRQVFHEYLAAQYADENLLFWEDASKFKYKASLMKGNNKMVANEARRIYDTYFAENAPKQINVPAPILKAILNVFDPEAAAAMKVEVKEEEDVMDLLSFLQSENSSDEDDEEVSSKKGKKAKKSKSKAALEGASPFKPDLFEAAQKSVFNTLQKDSFVRFLHSEEFKKYLAELPEEDVWMRRNRALGLVD